MLGGFVPIASCSIRSITLNRYVWNTLKQVAESSLAGPQRLLGLLAFGDVAAQDAIILLISEGLVMNHQFHGDQISIFGTMHCFKHLYAALFHLLPMGRPLFRRETGIDIRYGHGQQFFTGVSQLSAGRGIDVRETSGLSNPENTFGQILDGKTNPLQGLLGHLAPADVAQHHTA